MGSYVPASYHQLTALGGDNQTNQTRRSDGAMQPQPQPEPDPEARGYCRSILWGRSCRWGDKCSYSHDVPEHLLAAQRAHVSAGQRSSMFKVRLPHLGSCDSPGRGWQLWPAWHS